MAGRVTFQESDDEHNDDDDADRRSEASSAVSGLHLFDGTGDKPPEEGTQPKTSLGRRLSWTSASTCDLSEPLYFVAKADRNIAEKFKVLLKPPQFDRDDLLCSVHNFIGALADYVPSIKQDKTFTVFKSIRSFLSSADSTRLFGLLVHFTYWNCIHPTARATMRALQEVEDLKLFTNIDVTTYDVDKRLHMPRALAEIEFKDQTHAAKNFRQIDAIFDQQCADIPGEVDEGKVKMAPFSLSISAARDHADGATVSSFDTDASLTSFEKEQLFLQLETSIVALFRKMGRSRFALVTGRQALISCCHFVVDEVLAMMYPWFAPVTGDDDDDDDDASATGLPQRRSGGRSELGRKVNTVDLRLRRLVHQSLSDIVDPSRVYTSTMLLNALLGFDSSSGIKNVSKKARGVAANDGKGKFFRTSAAIVAILGDSGSYRARKFLHRSGPLYVPLPGVVKPYHERHDKREDAGPRALLEKILHAETVKHEEKAEHRRHPKPLDFSHLFQNQPEADYFPKPVLEPPSVAHTILRRTNSRGGALPALAPSPSAGQLALQAIHQHSAPPKSSSQARLRSGQSPLRNIDSDLQSATDSLTLNSDGQSVIGNPLAEVPISVKAKTALMNLMVSKTSKLYAAGIQTDKTAMKIAIVQGSDDYSRQHTRRK